MNEPNVETMTATIHVLKLGNRQITLGMFKQLDTVSSEHVEVMGRVNVPKSDYRYADLIGRHKRTGELVCTSVYRPERNGYVTQEAFIEHHREINSYLKSLPLIVLGGAR